MHEIERTVLVPLPRVLGIDLSITNEVILLWVAAAVTFVLLSLAFRRKNAVPRGWFQNLFEALVEFIEKEAVSDLGKHGKTWGPFLLALFFFILFMNLVGLIPVPSVFQPMTAKISVTIALALVVYAVAIVVNIRTSGVKGFLRRFVPSGVPAWVLPLVVPVEILSWLAKPVSLAIRLFANMFAGHALIFAFTALAMAAAAAVPYLVPLPLAGAVIMSGFELFVSFIQAFIFTMLAAIYINEAASVAH